MTGAPKGCRIAGSEHVARMGDQEAGGASSGTARVSVDELLDETPTSRFHHKAVVVSGVGFFTDAYDLFVIGTVATLVAAQWRLTTTETSWVSGSAILGAFFGALVFGRAAGILGRKRVYTIV
ncbi:MAG: MFS transporter, partial [Actinomycetota bacterium]|nr:MFS transporter [Actinomycetota bacterium]